MSLLEDGGHGVTLRAALQRQAEKRRLDSTRNPGVLRREKAPPHSHEDQAKTKFGSEI